MRQAPIVEWATAIGILIGVIGAVALHVGVPLLLLYAVIKIIWG